MEERGPREVELWVGQTHGLPGWFTGMFVAVARHLGLQGTRISVKAREGEAAKFLIQWE